MQRHYTKITDFGRSLNAQVENPLNAANPLTYCMVPTLNSQFFHGGPSGYLLYGNANPNCMSFMSERCKNEWDGYCQAFVDLNSDSYWPNGAVLDTVAFQNAKTFLNIKTTVGQDMLRNSCYHRFLFIPNLVGSEQPFDPTVANSPMITLYDNYVTAYSHVKNLSDPETVDKDVHVDKMMENPKVCLDVLGRIFLGYHRQEGGIHIKGTKLEEFFKINHEFLSGYVKQAIIYVPSFQRKNRILW